MVKLDKQTLWQLLEEKYTDTTREKHFPYSVWKAMSPALGLFIFSSQVYMQMFQMKHYQINLSILSNHPQVIPCP